MKKKFVLTLSSILLSIGLLVGCSSAEEPGFEDDPIQNGNPEQSETEFDPAGNEDDMNEGMNEDMNEGMNEDMNEGMNEDMNEGMNEEMDGEISNEEPEEPEEPDETEQP